MMAEIIATETRDRMKYVKFCEVEKKPKTSVYEVRNYANFVLAVMLQYSY